MATLTDSQIEHIYSFTKMHYVEWYDVQTELVDHLANGIENEWKINPNISFNQALNNEFKKFGVFGFSDLIEKKTNALNKQYRKQVFKCFKAYFKFPKIIATGFSMWLFHMLFSNLENKLFVIVPFVLIIFIVYVLYLISRKRKIRLAYKATGKKWLFENEMLQLGGLVQFLYLGIYIPQICDSDYQWSSSSEIVFSILIIFYILIFYASVHIVPNKFIKKMKQEFPEYIKA